MVGTLQGKKAAIANSSIHQKRGLLQLTDILLMMYGEIC